MSSYRNVKIITIIITLSAFTLLIDSGVAAGDFGQFYASATLASPTTINLSWPATCSGICIGEYCKRYCTSYYRIYRNWEYLTDVYTTSFSDQGLDSGTEYCYRVYAYFSFSTVPLSSYLVCLTTPGVLTLKVPSAKQVFTYPPVLFPQKSTHPSMSMPLGIGSVALNGDTLNISIGTYQFSAPVDIYAAYIFSLNPDVVFNLKSDFIFQTFSLDQVRQALSTGQMPVGAEPLIRNAVGPIDVSPLENVPVTGLAPGLYNLYLLATPEGSFQSYYLWNTYFSLPKLQNTVWSWGNNDYGQLGDGTKTARNTPVQASGLSNVIAISAGEHHTIALKSDGTVWTWGANFDGQLGDGTITSRSTPTQVSGLNNVIAVAAGTYYTVAVKSDGSIWTWGNNYGGQLGDGTTINRSTPIQVSGLNNVIAVAAGQYHTVAVKSDGTVWTWGDYAAPYSTPVQVSGLNDVTSVAAGIFHTVVLKSDGTVWTWGANFDGQLGDGTTINRSSPMQVSGLGDVIAITAGGYSTFVLKADGTVWAWGNNYGGQLGDGTTINRAIPVQTSGISDVVAISTRNYPVALKSDGTVWTWGEGGVTQLQVDLTGVIAITVGGSHWVVLK